jgi:hypothetical protein
MLCATTGFLIHQVRIAGRFARFFLCSRAHTRPLVYRSTRRTSARRCSAAFAQSKKQSQRGSRLVSSLRLSRSELLACAGRRRRRSHRPWSRKRQPAAPRRQRAPGSTCAATRSSRPSAIAWNGDERVVWRRLLAVVSPLHGARQHAAHRAHVRVERVECAVRVVDLNRNRFGHISDARHLLGELSGLLVVFTPQQIVVSRFVGKRSSRAAAARNTTPIRRATLSHTTTTTNHTFEECRASCGARCKTTNVSERRSVKERQTHIDGLPGGAVVMLVLSRGSKCWVAAACSSGDSS